MSEVKHTPGPWKFFRAKLRRTSAIRQIQAANGDVVIHWGGFDAVEQKPRERDANARLIAAAPELYEALQLLETAEHEWANCIECRDSTQMPELCDNCFPFFDKARLARRAALAKVPGK